MTPLRILAAAAVATVALGLGVAAPAAADGFVPITGSGSTWSQNALDQWRKNVASNYGMTVNFSGTGSSAGRQDYLNGAVDFAVSEIPFQFSPAPGDPTQPEGFNQTPSAGPQRGYAYMPIVAGGTALMYNLKISGQRVTNLRLSGDTIARIFTGQITNWNDAAIAADNPGLTMPDKAITVVVRSDGSGSTAQFTGWMAKQHNAIWRAFYAPGVFTSQYPTFSGAKAQSGSLGVAGYVSQDYGEGSITYVEYSYALKSGFPVAKVLNAAGYYIEPTSDSVAVALLAAQINQDPSSPDYLTQVLDGVYQNVDPRTYPMSSYSYMIVPVNTGGIFTAEKGSSLAAFARYVLCEGQQQAPALGYSPLPLNLVLAGSDQIRRIPGSNGQGVDTNSCNNPTFQPGDTPGSNRLAQSAPQPQDCDKKGGPVQCSTGTGGAAGIDTPTAGGGGQTGTSTNGPGGSNSGAQYDANGALIGGGGGNAAVSRPFALPQDEFGSTQWLLIGAGVLLVVAVLLPPLISRRLKRMRPVSRE